MSRPRNPYTSAPLGVVPPDVERWLYEHLRASKTLPPAPSTEFWEELPLAISAILAADLPRPLRYIVALLTFGYFVRPDDVKIAVKKAPGVIVTRLPIAGYPRPAHILSHRRSPTATELSAIGSMWEDFREIDTHRFAKTAETYVHGLLTYSRAYERTLRSRLGEHRGRTQRKADLVMTEKGTGRRWAIEVKNWREFIPKGHPVFQGVLDTARDFDAEPWLIAAHMFPEAKRYAHSLGIRRTELGSQILPFKTETKARAGLRRPRGRDVRRIVERARHIIGPEPYMFVPHDRFPARSTWANDDGSRVLLDLLTIPHGEPDHEALVRVTEHGFRRTVAQFRTKADHSDHRQP